MGNIGNLWVKLGLKSDDFSKGLNQAASKTKSFSNEAGRHIGTLVSKWASIGTAVAAVTKFVKDSIAMTQKWGDQWSITMDGIKSAYGVFVRQLSSGEGWSNLFANMEEAYRKGKEVAAALDEIFERKTSYSYSEAETNKYISEQQLIMRDASKSDAERKQAAQNIIDAEKKLGETKKQIWTDEAQAMRARFQLQTGLDDEQTDFMLKNYNLNREIINDSRAYLEERKKLETELRAAKNSGSGAMSRSAYKDFQERVNTARQALNALDSQTSQTVKDVAELTKAYDKSDDELVKGMADAEIAVINIDTEVNRASTRATAMLGSLEKATSGIGLSAKEAKDALSEMALAWKAGYSTDMLTGPLQGLSGYTGSAELGNAGTTDLAEDSDRYARAIENVTARINDWNRATALASEMNQALSDSITFGLSGAMQELTDQLFGISDANPGAIFSALLSPLFDICKQMGEVLIATGLGIEAFKASLATLNPAVALTMGAALLAIGAVGSSAMRALANGGSGSAAGSAYSDRGNTASAENIEMTINIEGKLKGSDIVLAGQRTQMAWAR